MKKSIFFACACIIGTLLICLGILRLLAPKLLGISVSVPIDMQMVQVDEKVPPFFEGVFREADYRDRRFTLEFIIKDPYLKRAKPLMERRGTWGPHDLLGFRNTSIPNTADLITIGDSQTYGNNSILEMNWPNRLKEQLKPNNFILYSMAVGGWGPIEYLEITPKALLLKPRVLIVAFYTGNDPMDAFKLTYSNERWADLRPDNKLSKEDAPVAKFPPPKSEFWPVRFEDGYRTIFTPKLRAVSNQEHPAVKAAYGIMAEVGRRIVAKAQKQNVPTVLTIIPTKELVYEKKIAKDGLNPPPEYLELVHIERRYLEKLAGQFSEIPGSVYVDLLNPLQQAAIDSIPMYPANQDGHPGTPGYNKIAGILKNETERFLKK